MGAQHVRMPVSYDNDPLIIRLNAIGRELHQYLIRHVKDQGWGGRCSDDAWDPDYLAARIGATIPGLREQVEPQMQKLVTLNLVILEDGKIALPKWTKYQSDPTNAERQARWRERQKKGSITQSNDLTTMGGDGIGGDTKTSLEPSKGQVEETSIGQYLVDLIVEHFPDWGRIQVEQAVQDLRKGFRAFTRRDWERVVTETRSRRGASLPIYQYQSAIYDQARYHARHLERTRSPRPPSPPDFKPQTREEYLAGLTPEDRAKAEEFDRLARERHGDGGAREFGELVEQLAGGMKVDGGDGAS